MPNNNGHGNGSFIHGTPLDEPIDLVAVQADDELINALAAGIGVPTAAGGRTTPTTRSSRCCRPGVPMSSPSRSRN